MRFYHMPSYARSRRRGSMTVELLFNLPVWLIALLAIVEFGEVVSKVQQVSLASRVGAAEAAKTVSLPSGGSVPSAIVDAIEHQLGSSGICCSKVIVEHNAGGAPVTLSSGEGHGDAPSTPLPSVGTYVRVTVFARVTDLAPNLLARVGLDLSSSFLDQTTTFRYEMRPTEIR